MFGTMDGSRPPARVDITVDRSLASICTVVRVSGEIDTNNSSELRRRLLDCIREGQHFLVADLTELTYIESSGLGALIGALARVKENDGKLHLVVAAGSQPNRALEMTRISKEFPSFQTEETAIRGLHSSPCVRR